MNHLDYCRHILDQVKSWNGHAATGVGARATTVKPVASFLRTERRSPIEDFRDYLSRPPDRGSG